MGSYSLKALGEVLCQRVGVDCVENSSSRCMAGPVPVSCVRGTLAMCRASNVVPLLTRVSGLVGIRAR